MPACTTGSSTPTSCSIAKQIAPSSISPCNSSLFHLSPPTSLRTIASSSACSTSSSIFSPTHIVLPRSAPSNNLHRSRLSILPAPGIRVGAVEAAHRDISHTLCLRNMSIRYTMHHRRTSRSINNCNTLKPCLQWRSSRSLSSRSASCPSLATCGTSCKRPQFSSSSRSRLRSSGFMENVSDYSRWKIPC